MWLPRGPISAFIPVFGGDGRGAVFHVVADYLKTATDTPDRSKDPRIAALVNQGIDTADRALDAADNLPFPREGRWRRMRLTLPRSPRARLRWPGGSEPERRIELGGANDTSAQLGLALALIGLHRRSAEKGFIATGTLPAYDVGGIPFAHGPVGAVGGLSQKIAALADWFEVHQSAHGGKLYFFTPLLTEAGEPVADAHADDIAALVQRAQDMKKPLEIVHKPVASLKDAAEILDAVHPTWDWREFRTRAAAVLAALMATFMVAVMAWMFLPTKLSFAKLGWALGPSVQTPVAVKSQPEIQTRLPRAPCFATDGRPQLAFGEHLVMRIETGPTWASQSMLDALFDAAIVIVSGTGAPDEGGVSILRANQLHTADRPAVTEDGRIGFTVSVAAAEPAGLTLAAVIAQKNLVSYGREALERGLANAIEGKTGHDRIRAAAAFLEEQRGGYLGYEFHAAPDLSDCKEVR